MMDLRKQLEELIRERGLGRVGPAILAAARPSIDLRLSPLGGAASPGRSRFGGAPDLPSADAWPSQERTALAFVAQIRLEELRNFEAAGVLPDRGLLSFFYDVEGMPWGHFRERAGWRVLYFEDDGSVGPVAAPGQGALPFTAPAFGVEFFPSVTIPAPRSIEIDSLGLEHEEFDPYFELRDEVTLLSPLGADEPLHRILGHPDAVQGCMQRTAQFESRGERLADGVYNYYEHPRAAELIPGAHDWRLLLQVDSDERLNFMWGDAGRIFYWIHRDRLAAREFEQAWLFLQCG